MGGACGGGAAGSGRHGVDATLTARSNLAVVLLTRFCMTVEKGDHDYKTAKEDMSSYRSALASSALALEAVPQPTRMLLESEQLLRCVLESLERRKLECMRTTIKQQPISSSSGAGDAAAAAAAAAATTADNRALGRREAETLNNLSQVLFAGGESQLGEAELVCARALLIARNNFHADDEVILKLQCGLAHMKFTVAQLNTIEASPQELLLCQAKQREAIELYESVFEARRRLFGMDNEDTRNVASALARLRKMQTDPFSPFIHT